MPMPPKPTALKILEGNPGHRPLNKAEPKGEVAIPTAPKYLTPLAKREWKRVGRELQAMGILTRADRGILALYAQAWGRLEEAETALAKSGSIIKSPSGYPIQNPWLAIANKAADQVNKFGQQLGLSPSARTRIAATPTDASDDLSAFLNAPPPPLKMAE